MASIMHTCRPAGRLSALPSRLATRSRGAYLRTTAPIAVASPTTAPSCATPRLHTALFHTTIPRSKEAEYSPTDFEQLDVLGNTPVPATSIDICMSEGFQLNSGAKVLDGSGVLLIGGEAFTWRPWLLRGEKKLLNEKGQWEVSKDALNLLGLVWPRPDILILGLGPQLRPIAPELRKHISSLGMRVEILDTRNAASQFNLLATERGVNDVAAALIPIGWREGLGAEY